MSMMEPVSASAPPVVLIVEDDPDIVEVLEDWLTAEGYRVECAGTGLAGLTRLQAGGIDLVLLDVDLPALSGLDLCRAVRATPGAGDGYVPIIMVTGLVGPTARRAGFAAGADDYLLKPLDLHELLARVALWLRLRQQAAADPVERLQQVAPDDASDRPDPPVSDQGASTGRSLPACRPTVLLVEDDAAVSDVLTARLTRDGYVVRHAADGLEGVYALDEALLHRQRYSVVLLDLMLPEVDGLGLLHFLRGATHQMPVVAISASATHLAAAGAAGADALVPKPFDLERVVEVITRYCPNGAN